MYHFRLYALPVFLNCITTYAWPYRGGSHHDPCVDFILPVSVTAQNADYGLAPVNNNIDTVQFAIDTDTWSTLPPQERIVRNVTIDDTFHISARLCVPANGSKKNHLQIATHGLLFDKRYWDVSIDPAQYSYVTAALNAGYSILTYDRLTTGKSDKPDAYTAAQAPVELEILRVITEMARSGELLSHIKASIDSPTFSKIIHVGHSYGSILTAALLATNGSLSDAAVLTGFFSSSVAHTGLTTEGSAFQFAAENDPERFADRPSGYIVCDAASAIQTGFFSAKRDLKTGIGGFDAALLEYGSNTKQPVTVGEWLSSTSLPLGPAPLFKGPIQFNNGQYDVPNCAGDCSDFDINVLKQIYGNATNIDVYLQPGTGHGMTMHRNANIGYKATLDWPDKNGL